MKKKSGDAPSSVVSRSFELLMLSAKLGQKELLGRFTKIQAQAAQAHALVESLSHLRGAAMKVGQLLSIEARDFLPPEVVEILSKLQDQGQSLSPERVQQILMKELGPKIYQEIEELSPYPVASASIGQVHKARFRGQDVAIKVQFPGVAESISSDIKILRRVSEAFVRLSNKSMDLDFLFQELGQVLKQEVDYISEATHMEEYTEVIKNNPFYLVPQPVCELVSARVLGMTWMEGIRFDQWIKDRPTGTERAHFAKIILNLYFIEFFKNGFVQTDPNFGNFFFKPDTRQLVVLDFGAMKRFDRSFIKEYRELLLCIREGDRAKIIQKSQDMGLIDPRESEECLNSFVEMLRLSLEPFEAQRQPFDFGNTFYAQKIREGTLQFTRQIRFSAPPHKILFLHRKLGGIFRLLQAMKAQIDLNWYWDELISL